MAWNMTASLTNTQQAVELLGMLIGIPSVSRCEDAAATCLLDFIAKTAPQGVAVNRHLNNVWCVSPDFDASRPTLLLDAHIDTVKPVDGWVTDPFMPVFSDDKITGLGSNDDGASLVSLLQVFYNICRSRQPYNTVFLASAEEEVSGKNGIEAVVPLLPPISCAIIGEPTGMRPAVAEKGLMVLDCVAHGVSGHAARNEGVNAIYKALDDVAWFRSCRLPEQSALLGDVKMSVTQIDAGTQHNVVPDVCKFVVDVRSNDVYSNARLLDIIKTAVACDVVPRSMRLDSSCISQEHPLVCRAVAFGGSPFGSPTLSNQALLRFPTLKMGPGESSRSHTAGEYVLISEINSGIEIFCKILDGLNLQ